MARADAPVGTLDPDLLWGFLDELRAAGFQHVGDDQREWEGPLPRELSGFTKARTMRVRLNDGWPYQPPSLKIDGLRSWHANEGLLCLWQVGDDTRQWASWAGIRARIAEWANDAESGFERFGRALDPHLYWEPRDSVVALLDVEALLQRNRNDGHHGVFHAEVRDGLWLVGAGKGRSGEVVNGRFFYRPSIEAPPTTVEEVAAALTEKQRRRFEKDLSDLPPGSSWAVGLFWEVAEGTVPLLLHTHRSMDGDLTVSAVAPTPVGDGDLLRRAGPDAPVLQEMRVVVFGVGAIGSHIADLLARSGIGGMRLVDGDRLWPAGMVRHAAEVRACTFPKPHAMQMTVAPFTWTGVEPIAHSTLDPAELTVLLHGADLAIDATGLAPFTELLARVAAAADTPLLSVALYRGGAVARVRRQSVGDTPIVDRRGDWRYPAIPPGDSDRAYIGHEAGCAAPIHNAPPACVARAAAAAASVCVDELSGRRDYPDEVVEVYRPIEPPFDRVGSRSSPGLPPYIEIVESAIGALRVAARAAAPCETGGVLVGRVEKGISHITSAIEIPADTPSAHAYRVPGGTTTRVVEQAARDDPGVGYLGEWHSHPSDQSASPTDRETMLTLTEASGTGLPVLVVVRPVGDTYQLDAQFATESGFHGVDLVAVGDAAPRGEQE